MTIRSRLAFVAFSVAALLGTWVGSNAGSADKNLDIYLIDTEGGAATLIVTPQGTKQQLKEYLAALPAAGSYELKVRANHDQPARTALVEVLVSILWRRSFGS